MGDGQILHVLWEDGDELDQGHIYGVFSTRDALHDALDKAPHPGLLLVSTLDLDRLTPRPKPNYSTTSTRNILSDDLVRNIYDTFVGRNVVLPVHPRQFGKTITSDRAARLKEEEEQA